MAKEKITNTKRANSRPMWLLLFVLLFSLLVTSVMAQDDGLDFVSEEGPQSVVAPAADAWIPATRDTFVSSNNPNNSYGSDQFIRFGMMPDGLGATRPLIYFDLQPYIPSQAKIVYAELHIYLASITPSGDSGRGYAAHHLAQSWGEGSVTWNNMPQWGSEFARGTLPSSGGWHVTNITGLAKEWQNNPNGNNGILLLGDERPDQNFERAYYSKEAGNGLYPRLFIQYDNSQDTTPPVAQVTVPTPPGVWSPANFVVKWQGNDPNNPDGTPGSGIRWYDVYYSIDGGNKWTVGRAQVTTTETNAIGAAHLQRYDFYARARDNAGNEGSVPSGLGFSQTWTRVDGQPPNATVNQLADYTTTSSFPVSWQDTKESGESGLKYYDVQWRADGGQWNIFVYNTTQTTSTFTDGQNGVTYEFRARGVDNVGNQQPWGDPQAGTLIFLQPVARINPFNPTVYQELGGPASGQGFTVSWEAITPPGTSIQSFDVRYQRPGNATWLSWLTGTTQTASFFELLPDDVDGSYKFEVRATDSNGVTGEYYAALGSAITVDRFEPFIMPRVYFPFIINTTNSGN